MGTASSIHSSHHETNNSSYSKTKREKVVNRHDIINKVEKFIVEVYFSFPTSECLRMILSNYLAYSAFEKYMNSLDNKTSDFKLYQTITNILELSKDGIQLSQNQLDEVCSLLVDSELTDKNSKADKLYDFFRFSITSPVSTIEYHQVMKEAKNNMNEILKSIQQDLLDEFSTKHMANFLSSKYYRNWRATEYAHAIVQTAEDHSVQSSSMTIGELKRYSSIGSISIGTFNRNFSNSAFENIDKNEAENILGRNNWLSALSAGVEGLPTAFSISTVNAARNKFPIIFINSYYEKMFGITKSNILNNFSPLWLLPLKENEKETIQSCMESSKEYTTILSYPKDNDYHLYIISVKPIFTSNNILMNVLCLYVDLGSESAYDYDTEKDILYLYNQKEIVKKLMNILPNMLLEVEHELD